MQATHEAEPTYKVTVHMGKGTYETELEYTRAQAEEIHKITVKSAKAAVWCPWFIEPVKVGPIE